MHAMYWQSIRRYLIVLAPIVLAACSSIEARPEFASFNGYTTRE